MSYFLKRLSNLSKTNKFSSSKFNPVLEIGIEPLAQTIAYEIVENLNQGMFPEIAASLPFKKYSLLFKPFLTKNLAKRLENRLLFYLKILVSSEE